MATTPPHGQSSTDARTTHSKDDCLSELAFEELYNASFTLDAATDLEARFVLLVGGRLGLRRGEIAHMSADWIDWRNRRISIPHHVDCDRGRDYRACATCRQHARQKAARDDARTFEDALAECWQPKTRMAVREVPFDFCPRAEIVLQEYFDRWDHWMYSAQAINRRVERLAEAAGLGANLYPHALRATAASFLAGRGMSTLSLQAMFGWAEPSTARAYVAQSAENTARELHLITG